MMALKIEINPVECPAKSVKWIDDEADKVRGCVDVIKNPFHNCQSFSIASGYALLQTGDDPETVRLVLKKIIEAAGMKPQGIFDIQTTYVEEFLKAVTPWALVIHQMPYKSTNNSQMVLMIIQFNTKLVLA